MVVDEFVIGTKVIVSPPTQDGKIVFDSPFDIFSSGWKQWVEAIAGKEVVLQFEHIYRLFKASYPGWEIEDIGPSQAVHKWLPVEWMVAGKPTSTLTGSKIPCNCSLNKILFSGCKQPNHE